MRCIALTRFSWLILLAAIWGIDGVLLIVFPSMSANIQIGVSLPTIFTLYFFLSYVFYNWRSWSALRMIKRQDKQAVIPLELQPETSLALAPGQTIQLSSRSKAYRRYNILAAIIILGILFFLPFLVIPNFFDIRHSVNTIIKLWSIEQYLIPIIWALFLRRILQKRAQKTTITANDDGIHIRMGKGPITNVRWNDIKGIVDNPSNIGDAFLGAYYVVTKKQMIRLYFLPFKFYANDSPTNIQDFVEFSDDPAMYREKAEQILATIVARSGVTLCTLNMAIVNPFVARVYPLFGQNFQKAAMLPLALQPDDALQEIIASSPSAVHQVQPIIRFSYGLRFIYWKFFLIRPLSTIFLVGTILTIVWYIHFPFLAGFLGIIFILLFFRYFFGYFFGGINTLARSLLPTLTAFPEGLQVAVKTKFGKTSRLIPWSEITGWVTAPATPQRPYSLYALFSGGKTLTWIEPIDGKIDNTGSENRHDDYQTAVQYLHAFITVRSGQNLRIFTS